MTTAEEIRNMLRERGVPESLLEGVSDEELLSVAKSAEDAANDIMADNHVKRITMDNGEPGFEIETEFYKMEIPARHLKPIFSMLAGLMSSAAAVWHEAPDDFKKRTDPMTLAGMVLTSSAETIRRFVESDEDIMEELILADQLAAPVKKPYNDHMYG